MATAPNSLSSELECAICSDQLDQPKFIGSCNHTFCKNCIDQLWVTLGRRRTVPCPHCREECPIPSNGAGGLKDNLMVANIIETYRNQQQKATNLAEIKCTCTLCPNRASGFCKDCDLKLCPGCKRRHDRDPNKHDHDLFGLCRSHGNGLFFFCNPCKQAVCGGCRVTDHNAGDHHVIPIRPVFADLLSDIQTNSAELEDAIRTQVRGQEKKLSQLRDIVQQKSTSAEVEGTASIERNIDGTRNEITALKAESQNIQRQIDILVMEKEEVDDMIKQRVEVIDKFEYEKTRIIANVRERFAKSSDKINQRLRSLETRRKEMTSKLEQGRAVGSTKITIDTESIANLTSISQELFDFVNAAREIEIKAVTKEFKRSISGLGFDIVDMGQGLAVMSGDHQIRIGKTELVFRQLKKACTVTFPRELKCKVVYRLKHLNGPDSRLVTLGTSVGDHCSADTIYFHDTISSSFTGTITEGVHPAHDMSVSSTGEVVVARLEKPPLRVFNPATGAYRDIYTTYDGKLIVELSIVETDESDMFVSTGGRDPRLLVMKPNGNVIQSIQLRGYAYNMAFSSLNRILYIAAGDRIRMFYWTRNKILKEIASSSHGVAEFCCNDVCIGSGGKVLVVGRMGNGEIVIYQVTEGEDEGELVWRKIEYLDGVKRQSRSYIPRICINDDNLWLGYEDVIDKFQLV